MDHRRLTLKKNVHSLTVLTKLKSYFIERFVARKLSEREFGEEVTYLFANCSFEASSNAALQELKDIKPSFLSDMFADSDIDVDLFKLECFSCFVFY